MFSILLAQNLGAFVSAKHGIPAHEDLQLTASGKICLHSPLRAMPRLHGHPEQLALDADGYCVYCHHDGQSVSENPLGAATTVTPA